MAVGRSRLPPLLCYAPAVMDQEYRRPLSIRESLTAFGALGLMLAVIAVVALVGVAVLLWAMRTVF
jgi:hypothetical protein